MEHENQCNKDDCFCRCLAVDMSGLFGHLLGSKLVQFRVGLVLKVFQHLNLGKLTPKHQAQVGTRSKILQNAEYAECFKKLRRYCTSRDASTWLDSFAENSPRGELLGFGQCCHSCSRRLVALESRMPLMTLMIRYDKHPCSAALPHCRTAALLHCRTAPCTAWALSLSHCDSQPMGLFGALHKSREALQMPSSGAPRRRHISCHVDNLGILSSI